MTRPIDVLFEGLHDVLEAERSAIAKLDLEQLEFLTQEKLQLTQSLEVALIQPQVRDDPDQRRQVARAVSSIRRQAAVNAILLQDAQTMVSRVRAEPSAAMTYDPRACGVRARSANEQQAVTQTGTHD